MAETQREVIAFLRDPESYPGEVGAVEVIETHASLVFLAGNYAYKLKRAAKYAYLDFSTLAQRCEACTAELNLNRRTAPQLYLEIRAISRRSDGSLAWGRGGEVLDFVVVMARFSQEEVLDNVAHGDGLPAPLLYALAAHIADFHAAAEKHTDRGGARVMAGLVDTNIGILREAREAGFDAAQIDRIESAMRDELARVGPLLDERRAAGKVRRGHGDLHLRNICLVDGKPVLFDCVEFSEELGSIDVLYDLAFLLMDLEHSGQVAEANLVMNRYLDLTEEDDGLAAMPLFLALRAVIRAHVTATMAQYGWGGDDVASASAEARRYLDQAEMALLALPPRLIAVGGLSGSGKSTLAARLAPILGRRPGARVLRSDVLRKLRFGGTPETPLPSEAYTSAVTSRVYHDLCERAAKALAAGHTAVIDAVSLKEEERRAFADVAAAAGIAFTGLWLSAPPDAMAVRLATRRGDASDASPLVLKLQLAFDPGTIEWIRIDAAGDPAATLAAARRALVH